jgi:hypothetical protein
MTLATYTATLLAAVRAAPDTSLDAHAEALGASPQRLGIYRSFVRDHVTSVLAKLYPATHALLAPQWDVVTTELLAAHPPRFRDLNLAGEPLPRLLDARGHAFEAALAQLEWELFATAVHPAVLAPSDAPTLNPTLTLFEQHHPAVQLLATHDDASLSADTPRPARLEVPQVVVVFRKQDHTVSFRVLDPLSARAIEALAAGAMPDDDALGHALALGLVIAPAP